MSRNGPLGSRQLSIVEKVSEMFMKLKSEQPISPIMHELLLMHPDYWNDRDDFMEDITQLHGRGYIYCRNRETVVPTHKALIALGYKPFPKSI